MFSQNNCVNGNNFTYILLQNVLAYILLQSNDYGMRLSISKYVNQYVNDCTNYKFYANDVK